MTYRQLSGADILKASTDLRALRDANLLTANGKSRMTCYTAGTGMAAMQDKEQGLQDKEQSIQDKEQSLQDKQQDKEDKEEQHVEQTAESEALLQRLPQEVRQQIM